MATERNEKNEQHEVDQPVVLENTQEKVNYKIEIPEAENFVFEEKSTSLSDTTFVSESVERKVQDIFLRPLIVGEPGKEVPYEDSESALDVKSTAIMTKASFVEFPTSVDGVDYNFIQWKGSCPQKALEKLNQRANEKTGGNIEFPVGNEGIAPLFTIDINGQEFLVRFMGTSYYDDLVQERKSSEMVQETGLRMPRIMGTFKFSRDFCQKNNLPLPESDDPNDFNGESLRDYIEARKSDIDPAVYERLKNQYDKNDFDSSAILGENVRVFRNIFRVMDVEEALKETDEQKRKEKISVITEASKKIFQKEFNREIDDKEMIAIFSGLLGQQVSILLKNRIVQGAMSHHKQDITLAAEICDFDTAYKLTDEYFKGKPDWARENEKEKLVRQIFLVASHIKPVLQAVREAGSNTDEGFTADKFVDGIVAELSEEEKKELLGYLVAKKDDLQNIECIAGKNEYGGEPVKQVLDNLKDYQDFFDLIRAKLESGLKRKEKF